LTPEHTGNWWNKVSAFWWSSQEQLGKIKVLPIRRLFFPSSMLYLTERFPITKRRSDSFPLIRHNGKPHAIFYSPGTKQVQKRNNIHMLAVEDRKCA
jgi:hypothetical protein